MKNLQTGLLVASTITAGLMAGLFFTFAVVVMPALRSSDDEVFVSVMNRINVVIVNPVFLLVYMGGLIFSAVAAILVWRDGNRTALPWVIAGLVLYVVMFLVTSGANIPLNDQLATVANGDFTSARAHFEGAWVVWNVARTLANVAAFGCLAYALVLHGRGNPVVAAAPPVYAPQAAWVATAR
ncbi:DUF1772 domain-containing protein [Antrihabitans stalactiti]|uniref:DUF1772 domain-containing protein n=1 Tax=Antrihabitans stalactiti TaxID=2584121 RepID=A0A848KAQ3_9NOCA|nr:anthrone oxygenase family protein [Antrihabitans stalactiti]NMN94548.1 DUF1772 domain-containing protein [Antrihabitans stalactiti]